MKPPHLMKGTLALLLGSALSGNGQDRDLRISCRLRILRPALAAVATSQLVATTDAEYHGRSHVYRSSTALPCGPPPLQK